MSGPRPYGSWDSPITAAVVARGSVRISDVQADRGDLYWIESRPDEDGRHAIVRLHANGSMQDLLPPEFNARTRVHEYGGGHFTVRDGVVWFSNFADQRLYRIGASGEAAAVTRQPDRHGQARFADGVATRGGDWVICVREVHPSGGGPDDVVNDLVAVPADGRGVDTDVVVLARGHDFYGKPRLSPDGTRLAWLTWDHPAMPWDATTLHVGELDAAGGDVRLVDRARVAGGDGTESVTDPAWSPDGTLHAVTDRSGWWNLHRFARAAGGFRGEVVHQAEAEFARPMWVLGPARYGFLDDGRLACTWFEDGFDRVGLLDADTHELEPVDLSLSTVDALVVDGTRVVVAGGSATDLPALRSFNPVTGTHRVLHDPNDLDIDEGWFPRPEARTYATGNEDVAHTIVYPPTNPQAVADDEARPPLVVFTHGGPTSHVRAGLSLEISYFTSRGFAVADLNYRGSTGYGRDYREKLYGRWGKVDVEDAVHAARYLSDRGEVDPRRMAVRGGSAGGYTTLCALAFEDLFTAGASYYGVADVRRLDEETHKFESRYMQRLIPPDEYEDRSPLHHADGFSAPMILFQGLEDEIVPPAQAEALVETLKRKRLPHAYATFAGEQHGFRRARSIIRALEAELVFYGKVFRFEPAGDLPDVEVRYLA